MAATLNTRGEPRRRAGRPPQTPEEAQRAREHIVAATAEVFAEHGYHGMSVALVLERAEIARPTFYRYFRNIAEPLHLVLKRLGDSAAERIEEAVARADDGPAKVLAAVEAHLGWTREHHRMLPMIFAGVNDPTSPVSVTRRQALDRITALLVRELEAKGGPIPDPWVVDVVISTIEYTGYRVQMDTPADEESLNVARAVILRLFATILADPPGHRSGPRPGEPVTRVSPA